MRDFVIQNALYWLEEFRFDGLRLDAVHAIADDSTPDILVELAETVRSRITDREVHLTLENDRNEARRLGWHRDRDLARGYSAQWNDDLHHALHVLLTGEASGYYADYADCPALHLGRALATGFAFQGEPSLYRGGTFRGEPSYDLPPTAFVSFLQNHDQIGNTPFGTRIEARAPEPLLHAAVAIVLLSPQIPMLFMGEEWASKRPFQFFCDFGPPLAEAVRQGRRLEFAQFADHDLVHRFTFVSFHRVLQRHARACRGHPRLMRQGVDGRNKSGHDEEVHSFGARRYHICRSKKLRLAARMIAQMAVTASVAFTGCSPKGESSTGRSSDLAA